MQRSKSLSTRYVKAYKLFLIILVTVLGLGYATSFFTELSLVRFGLGGLWFLIVLKYWYPNFRKFIKQLKEVSYDDENLYVKEGDYEVQIPFHQIKDIEIVSLDGLYKFKLFHHDQFGDEVVCKPSMWYPLNYKRVDKELNRIRALVRKAQREYKEKIGETVRYPVINCKKNTKNNFL